MPMITLAEQIAEAQRELELRRQCYPGWIKSGKLDSQDAYHQLQCMEAIVRTLRQLDAEQRQLSLFGTGTCRGAQSGPEHPLHWCGINRLYPACLISMSNQAA
jgi:hypothetical protein